MKAIVIGKIFLNPLHVHSWEPHRVRDGQPPHTKVYSEHYDDLTFVGSTKDFELLWSEAMEGRP